MKDSNKLNPSFQRKHWENSYGLIPHDWDFVTIGSLFQERREQSSNKDVYPLYSFTIEDGVTPKTDRYERGFLLKDKDNNQFSVVHPGDFVSNPMNLRFGAISYSKVGFPVLVSAYYNILKPKLDRCSPDFMEALLKSYIIMNLYDRIAIGSLIEKRRIHLSILNQTFIAIPPPKEQEIIGERLKTWDKAITQAEKLIEAKQKLKKGLMQQLLTGRRRFLEFGLPVTESKQVPLGWQEVKIGEIFKRVNRKNSSGVTRVLTASGEHGLVDQRDFFNRSVAGESLDDYIHVKKGEYAFNRSSMQGYPYGAIKRLNNYSEGVLSTLYICFVLSSQEHCSDFLMHYFEAGHLNQQLRGIVQVGARAHGLLNVTIEDFFSLKLLVPSSTEQERIAPVLNALDSEIRLCQNKLSAIQKQKRGLMQKLLTGQIRVKAIEEIQ